MSNRPYHRLTLDINPKLWAEFKEVIPRGFVKLLVEAFMEDFLAYAKRLDHRDRTMLIGLIISRKYSLMAGLFDQLAREGDCKDDD